MFGFHLLLSFSVVVVSLCGMINCVSLPLWVSVIHKTGLFGVCHWIMASGVSRAIFRLVLLRRSRYSGLNPVGSNCPQVAGSSSCFVFGYSAGYVVPV